MTSQARISAPRTIYPGKPEITLVETCGSCPEQYEAFAGIQQVGYLRLRHGYYAVYVPDQDGDVILTAHPAGDGMFDADERQGYLDLSAAIRRHMKGAPIATEITQHKPLPSRSSSLFVRSVAELNAEMEEFEAADKLRELIAEARSLLGLPEDEVPS